VTVPPVAVPGDTSAVAAKDAIDAAAAGWWRKLSLLVAPVLIAILAAVLFLYYRSLGVGTTAPTQVSSALNWETKLWPQLKQHLNIALWSTLLVIVVAVPLGILLTRPGIRRAAPWVMAVANSGQALPAYGLMVVFLAIFGQGTRTVIIALALYALLPILRNTMVGLDAVDRSILEAGRGMGMTRTQVLIRIELPLAVPVIIAGIRVAMIINIGMATLAYLIGGGALGVTIGSGLKLRQDSVVIFSAALVALVALTFDWFGAVMERVLHPRGL
jgi:osmoprotectant transport system permease protein